MSALTDLILVADHKGEDALGLVVLDHPGHVLGLIRLAQHDLAGLLKYTKERVPAFVNTFGALDPVVVSAGGR